MVMVVEEEEEEEVFSTLGRSDLVSRASGRARDFCGKLALLRQVTDLHFCDEFTQILCTCHAA